ncbi:MAG: stage III sporulation protein AG [Lachnospiraceae bacterium]|nr:stage III sporulation protein AG [Lachnospiraceae bacterium]
MKQNWKIWEKGNPWFLKKENFLLLILFGMLLMVVVWPTSKKEKEEAIKEASLQEEMVLQEQRKQQSSTEMEERLTSLLEAMDGVGRVQVMITYQASAEQVPLKDLGKELEEETIFGEEKTGEKNPYIVKEYSPVVEGVTVVCEGGDDFIIQKNITETVQALFGTSPHKIKVVKMKQTE